jgi:hypothetical protein
MKGVRVHAALLAVAVLLAFQAWLREEPSAEELERPLVWALDTADVTLEYRAGAHTLHVGRRTVDDRVFLWGVETTAQPGGEDVEGADTSSYPLGMAGAEVVRGLATLRVIRDLGEVPEERRAEYGLDEAHARIDISSARERRTLELGDSVFRSSDRYARDPESGRVYVIPSDLIEPLRVGSGAIRERVLHTFAMSEVHQVRVEGPAGSRVMERAPGGEGAADRWVDADAPDRADLTFANFMERAGQLAIADFENVPEAGLERVLRLDYLGGDGEPLGFVELMRGAEPGTWFVLSERTGIPARAVTLLAERVAQDAAEIF